MEQRIGFIGCGKMAQAMIQGILASQIVSPNQIMVSAKTKETLEYAKETFGVKTAFTNREVAANSDIVFLAIKPNLYSEVIEEITNEVGAETIVITIAAGISLDFIRTSFGKEIKAVRSMPNTPSLVGEGMSVICANDKVTPEDLQKVTRLFEGFGRAEIIEERLMDAVPAVSGSSPAYVYMFIEALADGAVMQGVPRNQAYRLAAQAVLGAAKMVLETGQHPGELKDNVCTPGGATIKAVAVLEKHNFRSSVISAMEACTKRSKELAQD
ncbi:pyrroline-5-carboxylate reductase [Fredinandcohnia humi]